MRLPLAATFNVAPPLSVRLATVALAERLTALPEMVTRSLAVGTPPGLQLAAVDQFPPLAGPIQVLVVEFPNSKAPMSMVPPTIRGKPAPRWS
jgi:hypothetical protein